MSSYVTRQSINTAIEGVVNPLPLYDLSDYVDLESCLPQIDSQAVLVQYSSAVETVESIGSESGLCLEESGTIVVHYVVPTGFGSSDTVQMCDFIRYALRGSMLAGKVYVESMSPFVDRSDDGGVNGAWHNWVSDLFYTRRVKAPA